MKEIYEFGQRANVESFPFNNKTVFIYQDHRTILNSIFFALKNNIIKKAPNVIYFDYHADACEPGDDILKLARNFDVDNTSEEEFNTIVEYKLRTLDDDWVKAGMQFGLINHSIVIGEVESDLTYDDPEIYTDINKKEHRLYKLRHLKFELGSRGTFGDSVKKNTTDELCEIFGFDRKEQLISNTPETFILDFDLDCFSTEVRGLQMAWPEKMFKEELLSYVGHKYTQPISFINQLIEKCEFITVCTEPSCCGGLGESFKILRYLDKYIFQDQLGTEPIL